MNNYLQGQCIWLIIFLLVGMVTGYIETQDDMVSFSVGFLGISMVMYVFFGVGRKPVD
jgi:hypothetical protein